MISHLLVWVDTGTVIEMGNALRMGLLFCPVVKTFLEKRRN